MGQRDSKSYGRSLKKPAWRGEASSWIMGMLPTVPILRGCMLSANLLADSLASSTHRLSTQPSRETPLVSCLCLGSFSLQLLDSGMVSFFFLSFFSLSFIFFF